MGIDGRIFPVSALDNRRKAKADELQRDEKFYPIHVKQRFTPADGTEAQTGQQSEVTGPGGIS